jgi:hypothetical protein
VVTRASIALLVLELAGCGSARLSATVTRSQWGPAAAGPVRRVVALGASCGSLQLHLVEPASSTTTLEVQECARDALTGTDQTIRSALDFAGYEVIDAEQVNAVTARRREVAVRHGIMVTRTTRTTGATFVDATPAEQTEILKELRADGMLAARVWIGAGVGFSSRRTVSVQLRLTTSTDRALVWARRCEIEVGVEQDPSAMQRAARCAAEGARPQ